MSDVIEILRLIFKRIKNFFEFSFLFVRWFGDIEFQKRLLKCCGSNWNILDKYNLLSVISIYLTPIAILSAIIGFYINSVLSIGVMTCVLIIWGIFVLSLVVITINYCKKSELYKNGTQNNKFSADKPHHGIVFVQYTDPKLKLFIADSIDLLVKTLNEHIPFKVYPMKNEDDFKQVYDNPKVRWLWILGHGEKRHLAYLEDDKIKYIEYENYKRNTNLLFIAQLHCNPGVGKSLLEINELTPDHDITKFRFPFQNRCYIVKKTQEFIKAESANNTTTEEVPF